MTELCHLVNAHIINTDGSFGLCVVVSLDYCLCMHSCNDVTVKPVKLNYFGYKAKKNMSVQGYIPPKNRVGR